MREASIQVHVCGVRPFAIHGNKYRVRVHYLVLAFHGRRGAKLAVVVGGS